MIEIFKSLHGLKSSLNSPISIIKLNKKLSFPVNFSKWSHFLNESPKLYFKILELFGYFLLNISLTSYRAGQNMARIRKSWICEWVSPCTSRQRLCSSCVTPPIKFTTKYQKIIGSWHLAQHLVLFETHLLIFSF